MGPPPHVALFTEAYDAVGGEEHGLPAERGPTALPLGALIAARGVAVVAVLVLPAMAE